MNHIISIIKIRRPEALRSGAAYFLLRSVLKLHFVISLDIRD